MSRKGQRKKQREREKEGGMAEGGRKKEEQSS
jgi:hypothetical protein